MTVRSNHGRSLRIGRFRMDRLRATAGVTGTELSRRRRAGIHRSSPNSVLLGSSQPMLGSGVTYATRVVHLGP
jgi:hypothetical protein